MENASAGDRRDAVSSVRLSVIEAGPAAGPAVILLHGFPEFSFSWHHQIPFLAACGFRVIAPDLRGYNTSDKPRAVAEYGIDRLVADVVALLDERGIQKAIVVGHDWGGIIAWFVAMWHPERVAKLVILNAPHPAAYVREVRTVSQLIRSWYVFLFQIPWLPEFFLRAANFAVLRKLYRQGPARLSTAQDADVDRYIAAAAQPGALTGMINYYRAALRMIPTSSFPRDLPITVPTLLIWGCRDRYLTPRLTAGLEKWVENLRIEKLPEATHWVHHDEPKRVNELLGQFLRATTTADRL